MKDTANLLDSPRSQGFFPATFCSMAWIGTGGCTINHIQGAYWEAFKIPRHIFRCEYKFSTFNIEHSAAVALSHVAIAWQAKPL